jgi:DICT domain-containing protein
MLAFSRAIEDACLAAGGATALAGCFQREQVYRGCESRWREMARGAEVCVVLADFGRPGGDERVLEVPIGAQSPLQREWAVAVTAPPVAACLAGWEWPGAGDGRFEAVWSVDPAVVRAAIDRALSVARVTLKDRVPDLPGAVVPAAVDTLVPAMRLLDRVVERLDR